jgi:hypothetical protein
LMEDDFTEETCDACEEQRLVAKDLGNRRQHEAILA